MTISYIKRSDLPEDDGWHIQIAENTNVAAWWYDEAPLNYWGELDPVKRMNRYKRSVVDWAYELAEPITVEGKLSYPVEMERQRLCVWQWVHNQGGGNGIYVAHNPEQAVTLAVRQIERSTRRSNRSKFRCNHVIQTVYYEDFDSCE